MVDLAIINEFPYIVRCAAQKLQCNFTWINHLGEQFQTQLTLRGTPRHMQSLDSLHPKGMGERGVMMLGADLFPELRFYYRKRTPEVVQRGRDEGNLFSLFCVDSHALIFGPPPPPSPLSPSSSST